MRYFVIFFVLFSLQARAEGFCDTGLVNTIKQAYPNAIKLQNSWRGAIELHDDKKRTVSLSKYASQCKVWPAFPNLAIVVMGIEEEEKEGLYDLEIFIVSIKDNKILDHYIDKNILATDGRGSASVKLDTAYYKLSDSVVAFGTRVVKSRSSSAFQSSHTNFHLYTFKDDRIKKVMSDLRVEDYHGETGMTCAGRFIETKRLVLIDKEKSSGFYNLKISSKKRDFDRDVKPEDKRFCFDKNNKYSRYSNVLKFNGTSYKIPSKPEDMKGY